MATVLITGSNRGIGLSLARAYAARGDRVIATCRAANQELRSLDVRVEEGVDVTSDAAVEALANKLAGAFIDVLICNAGLLQHQPLESVDFDSARKQFEINALGPLRVVRALRGNLGQGSKVALITSRMGSIADNTSGGAYGYRMSKAALNAAGVSLAHDLKGQGTAVVILHPGYVRTEMTGKQGHLEADESAALLVQRIDQLTPDTTGRFLHANGEVLPW